MTAVQPLLEKLSEVWPQVEAVLRVRLPRMLHLQPVRLGVVSPRKLLALAC